MAICAISKRAWLFPQMMQTPWLYSEFSLLNIGTTSTSGSSDTIDKSARNSISPCRCDPLQYY